MTRRPRPDEAGAYLVLYAVLAVVLFTVAALVLDITALRQDRKTSRFASDAAAAAGAASLDTTAFGAVNACDQAWGYFIANRPDADGTVTPPDCPTQFAGVCDATTAARTATGTTDTFTVEITHPVPDGHQLMSAEVQGGDEVQSEVPAHDGTDACKRLAVRVERTRDLSLAGIAGLRSASTDVHSVALSTSASPPNQLVALVVLDPSGCRAIQTVAGGKLAATATSGTGAIYVDSRGTTCTPLTGYVIDPANGAQDEIAADGGIYHVLGANRPFDIGDAGRLTPDPVPNAAPVGRAAVDARYGSVIATLQAAHAVGDGGLRHYPDPAVPAESCTVTDGTNLLVSGDRYIDCAPLRVQAGGRLTFSSDRVVARGGVHVEADGCLGINSAHCNPAALARNGYLFVQSGDLRKDQRGRLALDRTFVYLAPGGILLLDGDTANGNDLIWRAPFTGALEDLLFWSETPQPIRIVGQKVFQMEGIFFAPGTAGLGEVHLVPVANMPQSVVQLIANRVVVDGTRGGNADFIVGPDPFRVVQTPANTVRLIR